MRYRYPQRRGVAQPGSALDWGSSGRKFKSCHPDQRKAVQDGKRRSGKAQSRAAFSCLCAYSVPPRPGALVQGGCFSLAQVPEEHGVELVGALTLKARDDVAVGVQRDDDAAVPQAFAHHLGMHPGQQE